MPEFSFSFGKRPPSTLERAINFATTWLWLDPLVDVVVEFINRKILTSIDPSTLKTVFDELDRYWLRHSTDKTYSESQVRVIISMLLQASVDRKLTRKELLAIVDFIQRRWAPEIALAKEFTVADEVIDARVEATVSQAIDLYEKTYEERPLTPEEFVASTAEIIYHSPDGSLAQQLLGGELQIRNKLIK